ncbi:3389_t:CDS:2, partial [Funneliformis mosseae]
QPEALQMEFEYSAWKNFVENIANNSHLYNDSLSRKAQEMVSSFEVKCFNYMIQYMLGICWASLDLMDLGRIQSIAGHIWNDKNSEVRNFWDQQKISDLDNSLEILSKETKLQMAIADLKYVINKSEEATIHSDLIGERRGQILKSELKHKRKDFDVEIDNFFQSHAENINQCGLLNVRKQMKKFPTKRTIRKASLQEGKNSR